MAIWSSLSIAGVLEAGRIDADYFKPSDLETIGKITDFNGTELGSIADILNGRTPQDYNDSGSLAVVRSGDLVAPLIYPTCGRQFLKAVPTQECVHLHQGDILISSIGMGSIGKISLVVDPTDLITVSEVTILRDATIPPEFLFAYLASPTGQSQIMREVTGATGQQHLLKSKVKRIVVPVMPYNIDSPLRDKIQEAYQAAHAANLAYAEAEALLESALKLDELDRTPQQFYDRPSSAVHTADRFDAEYFQPWMQNLITTLSCDRQTIGHVASLSKRQFKPETGKEFHYIEIGDVYGNGIANSHSVAGEDAPSRATWRVQPGDIITTTVRPIRRLSAIINDGQADHVCSSGFVVLTPKNIAPELLLVYLRLPLICELLDMHTTASMYPAIAPNVLMNIPITLPNNATRHTIVAKVRESFYAQRESMQLLEEAKTIVEKASLIDTL